jgi:hypothetical protein
MNLEYKTIKEIESALNLISFCIGAFLCIKFYKWYRSKIKQGEITRVQAIKEYAAITLSAAPIITFASILGLGTLGRLLGIDLYYGEGCPAQLTAVGTFIFALMSILFLGVFWV